MVKVLIIVQSILYIALMVFMVIALVDGDIQHATLLGVLALVNKPSDKAIK